MHRILFEDSGEFLTAGIDGNAKPVEFKNYKEACKYRENVMVFIEFYSKDGDLGFRTCDKDGGTTDVLASGVTDGDGYMRIDTLRVVDKVNDYAMPVR